MFLVASKPNRLQTIKTCESKSTKLFLHKIYGVMEYIFKMAYALGIPMKERKTEGATKQV